MKEKKNIKEKKNFIKEKKNIIKEKKKIDYPLMHTVHNMYKYMVLITSFEQ